MKKSIPVVLVLLVLFGIIAIAVSTRSVNSRAAETPLSSAKAEGSSSSSGRKAPARGNSEPAAGSDDADMMLAEATPPPDIPPETGEFTRKSKRAYFRAGFTGFQTPLDDYQLDGLEVDAEGIRLAPPKPGEDPARIGVMQSPTIPLEHPSNMVLPLWRGEVPEGTTLQVEIATSADGENWTQWFPVDVAHDEISPTYPDGSPNPNYGATPGTPVGFGLELFPYMRYRVTMASADSSTPVLGGFEVFHTDSTDGEGYLANDPPPERAIIDAAAERSQRP